jgi:hypothetical protein
LKSETIVDVNNLDRQKASRLFRGVAGDEHRKGELFGSENLLKYKDGTFMNYSSRKSESRRYGVCVHDTADLLEKVKNLSEDDLDDLGKEGSMFGSIATDIEANVSDCDDDVNLGGMSQAVMDACEQVDVGADDPPIYDNDSSAVNCATTESNHHAEEVAHYENETQSPLHDALSSEHRVVNREVKSDYNGDLSLLRNVNADGFLRPLSALSSATGAAQIVPNTKIVGKTSDQIRLGKAGPTAFLATDLYLPDRKRRLFPK